MKKGKGANNLSHNQPHFIDSQAYFFIENIEQCSFGCVFEQEVKPGRSLESFVQFEDVLVADDFEDFPLDQDIFYIVFF